jgi:tRNA (guanine10-N2)-methyltransferase
VPGGRLVFFLPTVNEAYQEVDIRTMLCDGMELVANSLQDFGSWGRRVSFGSAGILHVSQPDCLQLITIKKTTNEVFPRPSFDPEQAVVGSDSTAQDHAPAHKNFREHYFARFGKGPAEAVKSGDPSTRLEVSQLDSVEK